MAIVHNYLLYKGFSMYLTKFTKVTPPEAVTKRHSFIHSFSSLSYISKASSKASSPHSAI